MSTIAYRQGMMCADTRAYTGRGNAPIGRKWKIRRLDDGSLIGVSTVDPGIGEVLMDWCARGRNPEEAVDSDSFTILIVTPDGRALLGADSLYLSGPIEADYYAIGSGAQYALGAMHRGASAFEAVQSACEFDEFSAQPVYAVTHFGCAPNT